jgi:hypothetical protein
MVIVYVIMNGVMMTVVLEIALIIVMDKVNVMKINNVFAWLDSPEEIVDYNYVLMIVLSMEFVSVELAIARMVLKEKTVLTLHVPMDVMVMGYVKMEFVIVKLIMKALIVIIVNVLMNVMEMVIVLNPLVNVMKDIVAWNAKTNYVH